MVTNMPQSDRMSFSEAERRGVYRAIFERRDIRAQFLPKPIPDHVLGRLLDAAHHAPSVGFMQPWDFIVIRSNTIRKSVHDCFLEANRQAAEIYTGERRALYESLKLEGILASPVNLCITCDRSREKGAGVGRQSDPDTVLYSTVCAIQNLWLAARAESLGVGWVSILDPRPIARLARDTRGIGARRLSVRRLCFGISGRTGVGIGRLESRESLTRLIHFDRWDQRDEQRAAELFELLPANGAQK